MKTLKIKIWVWRALLTILAGINKLLLGLPKAVNKHTYNKGCGCNIDWNKYKLSWKCLVRYVIFSLITFLTPHLFAWLYQKIKTKVRLLEALAGDSNE